jgi:hypothetical protein
MGGYEVGTCSGWETVVGCCENINEPFGSIKCRKTLEQLRNYYIWRRIQFDGHS